MDEHDLDKIDEVTLILMYLTLHDFYRAWKGFNWDKLNRLYENRWLGNPRNKAKSVVFTEDGLAESERLFQQYFSKADKARHEK